jgi:hypothetical protein
MCSPLQPEPLGPSSSLLALSGKEKHRWSRLRHSQVDSHRFVSGELQHLLQDLQRERGVWGPELPCVLDKWMLDALEGPSRMRRRLRRNLAFYRDYAEEPSAPTDSPENQVAPF